MLLGWETCVIKSSKRKENGLLRVVIQLWAGPVSNSLPSEIEISSLFRSSLIEISHSFLPLYHLAAGQLSLIIRLYISAMHSDSIISCWKSLTSGERSRLRKLQLEKVEREQLLEEKEALIMTEVRSIHICYFR